MGILTETILNIPTLLAYFLNRKQIRQVIENIVSAVYFSFFGVLTLKRVYEQKLTECY